MMSVRARFRIHEAYTIARASMARRSSAEVREKEAEFKPRVEESLGCTGVASLAQVGEDSEGSGRGGC